MNNVTGGIAKKIASQPSYIKAGIDAYRVALNDRKDWHSAVIAAIEAAIHQLPNQGTETAKLPNETPPK